MQIGACNVQIVPCNNLQIGADWSMLFALYSNNRIIIITITIIIIFSVVWYKLVQLSVDSSTLV